MTYDTLFNTSWQVLIGVFALWWVVFGSVSTCKNAHVVAEIDKGLLDIAKQYSPQTPESVVALWLQRLTARGLSVALEPDPRDGICAWRWLLLGFSAAGQALVLIALVIAFPATASKEAQDAGRWLLAANLFLCGVIGLGTVVVFARFDGLNALRELASPRLARSNDATS